MKKTILAMLLLLLCMAANAQDSLTFKGKIVNDEYQVWIEMNFYDKDVVCPGQEIFGENPGYLGAKRDTRKWILLDADIEGKTAQLTIINDYGSDDLTATLTQQPDGSYLLEQKDGSTLRIVVNNKWVKLPKRLTFKRENGKILTSE